MIRSESKPFRIMHECGATGCDKHAYYEISCLYDKAKSRRLMRCKEHGTRDVSDEMSFGLTMTNLMMIYRVMLEEDTTTEGDYCKVCDWRDHS